MTRGSGSGAATRTLSIVLGLAAVGLAVALTWQGVSRWKPAVVAVDGGSDAAIVAFDFDASAFAIDLDGGEPPPQA